MALMTTVHLPQDGGLFSALATFFATLAEKRARFAEYRQILNELGGMTDRDLDDVGISRLSIRDIAYQAVYGA